MAITLNGTTGITTPALSNSGTLTQTGAATLSSTLQSASTIGVGGATPAASGAGITFPATQSASTDANTLDDYEEGTFTASFTAAAGGQPTISYSYNAGRYVKVGKLVYFTVRLAVTTVSGGTSALCLVSGLPFTAVNSANSYPGSIANYKSSWATRAPDYGRMLANTTDIELYYSATTGESQINTNYLANGCNLILTGCYESAS
jgi:hypothetical protein